VDTNSFVEFQKARILLDVNSFARLNEKTPCHGGNVQLICFRFAVRGCVRLPSLIFPVTTPSVTCINKECLTAFKPEATEAMIRIPNDIMVGKVPRGDIVRPMRMNEMVFAVKAIIIKPMLNLMKYKAPRSSQNSLTPSKNYNSALETRSCFNFLRVTTT
jgi:hypothetical protein